MAEKRTSSRFAVYALVIAVVAAAAALVIHLGQALPTGPEPIAWDHEACAHCRMSVGEPRFAAQLQTTDGRVLDFDDPGCLLRYLDDHKVQIHAVYFHHFKEDRWLPIDKVAFVSSASPTPMGYGLGAVDAGTPGSITLEEARAKLRSARPELGEKS